MTRVDFDECVEQYNDLLNRQHSLFYKDTEYLAEYKVKIAHSIVKGKAKSILDYGCGIGRNIPYLRKYFPYAKIAGCDISEKSITYAQENYSFASFYAIAQMPYQDILYDLVFVANVFHHIAPSDRYRAVSLITRCLGKDADVIIFEHNPYNPVTRYMVNTCPVDKNAVLLKKGELYTLLEQSGLKVADCGYTLFFPSFLKIFSFFEYYFRYIPVGAQYFVYAKKG